MIFHFDTTPLGEPPSAAPARKWWILAALEDPDRILVFCSLTNANGIVSDPTADELETAKARPSGEMLRWFPGDRVTLIDLAPKDAA